MSSPVASRAALDGLVHFPSSDGVPPYMVFERPLIRSATDNRSYRLIRLQNDLEALLVHDASSDKAAAAVDVNVGHLSDPEQLQGLAHFCEHLLFMGNEKYPSENEYSEYLAKHSGHSNAYTGMDDTVYYFDVHPSALEGALDRFSQFFVSPLFSDSCTEREIRAVDSENSKNLQVDTWRMFQLDKATSSRSHAFWRFGTGNLKTLWEGPKALGLDVREELLKFYSRHYSSNVMKLAVLGKESLDDLTQLVVSKFSAIPNRHIIPDRFDGSPFTQRELSKLIFAKMVHDTNLLELTFPVPDQAVYYDTQPLAFISHYIGHEGVGSVASYLKKKGWVNSFQAGASGGATGFELFKLTAELTDDGLENHKEAIRVIFAYLDLLRSTPPQEWAFREQALLSESRFRFKSPSAPSSYVTSLAGKMRHPFPTERLLCSSYITNTFDPELIKSTLDLLRPEKCRIVVGSQNDMPGVEYILKEEWYGTQYCIQPLPLDLLATAAPINALALPPPNSFISTNFHVDQRNDIIKPTKRPNCVRDTALCRLWCKKDDRWWLPKAHILLTLRNPVVNSSCLNSLKSNFVTKLLKESLNEQLYAAELASLSYGVGTSWDSIVFRVDGYNEKLHLLLETVLKGLKDLKVDRQKFKLVKDEMERRWKNFVLEGPYAHASYWMDGLVAETHYTYEEKLSLINDITPEDIQAFLPELLSRGFVEALVHGNMSEQEALDVVDLPQKIFSLQEVPQGELKPVLPLRIPEGSNHVYKRNLENPSNVNSAVDYFLDIGDLANDGNRTKLLLLAQLMRESCFHQLRTIEQLGYVVYCYTKQSPGQCALKFAIQSERAPEYVEGRIENFLDWFITEKLQNMQLEEFEEMKTSLINRALEDFKNLWDETSHYWMHISSGYYAFGQREMDAEILRKITIPEMVEFCRHYIHPSSPHRAKCSTHVRSLHVPVPSEVLLQASQELSVEPTPQDMEFLQSKPDLGKLEEYLAGRDGGKETVEFVRKKLEEESKVELPFVLLKPAPFLDANKFKAGLYPGPAATPVEYWKQNAEPEVMTASAPSGAAIAISRSSS